jgi:NAD(P)-dependent dehydrogenase (short-subunit alcohol dehydrogenase family)
MELSGCVVIVTGSARGIGKAIASAYARRGAKLCLGDMLESQLATTADELRAQGATVVTAATDVTDPAQVQRMFDLAESKLGPLDVQVNNAGTFSYVGPLWEAPPVQWLRDIRVNLYGSFLCCREAAARMVKRGRGYIINMVSSGGVGDPHAFSTSYASSKAGLMRLTEGLAKEAAPHGVKVFAVAPPAVQSEMTQFLLDDEGSRKWRPEFRQAFADGTRWVPADAVAEMCVQLVSGRADSLTGRYFLVQPGVAAMAAQADRILREDLWTLRIRKG